MLESFKRSEAFFCGNRTLAENFFFIVEFSEQGIVHKEGRGACVSPINVIPTINVIKIDHKCNSSHKCNNF